MSWRGRHGRGFAAEALGDHERVVIAASLNKAFAAAGGVLAFQNREQERKVRQCGSTLMFTSPRWPDHIDLSVANILDPLDRAPDRHAYADRSPDWCPIHDDLPQLGGPDGMTPAY